MRKYAYLSRGVKKTVKAVRITSKILSTILLLAVVLLAVFLGGIRLFGLTPYTVLSGSMEPAYHVGSVIYVTDADPDELKIGDPVTYRLPSGTLVTHRINEIVEGSGGRSFILKGDANKITDGDPVPSSAIIGKPIFSIPYIGYVSEFVRSPVGLISLASVCIAVMTLSFVADNLLKEPKEEHSETEEPDGTSKKTQQE